MGWSSYSPSWFPLWSLYRWKLIACGCLYLTGIIGLIVTLTVNVIPNRPHEVLVPFDYYPSVLLLEIAIVTTPFHKVRPLHGSWDPSVPAWVQVEVAIPTSHGDSLNYAARPFYNLTEAHIYALSKCLPTNGTTGIQYVCKNKPTIDVYYHAVPNPELSYTELTEPTLYTTVGDGITIRDIFLLLIFALCIVGAACLNLMVVCDHWYPVYGTEQYVQKQTIMAQQERLASDMDEIGRPASRQKMIPRERPSSRAVVDASDDDDMDIHDSALDDAEQLARVVAARQARSNSVSEEETRRREQRREKLKLKSIKYQQHRDDDDHDEQDDIEMQAITSRKQTDQQNRKNEQQDGHSDQTVMPPLDLVSITVDPASLPHPPTDRQLSHRSYSLPEPPNPLLDVTRASAPRLSGSMDSSQ